MGGLRTAMEIEFRSLTHERLAGDYRALSKRYNTTRGVDSATAILMVLDVLRAAESLADVPPSFRPHPLKGSYKGSFAVNVDKVHRVVFQPNHGEDPGFRIDSYKTITRITISELFKDYH